MARINYTIMMMTFLLAGCNLSSQTINIQGNKVFLKEVRCIDSAFSNELVNLVNRNIKDAGSCKYLKYLLIEISNYEPDTLLFIKQFDFDFILVNQILNNSIENPNEIDSQDNDYYFMKIDDFVFISRKAIFKIMFNESKLNFHNSIDSIKIKKKFLCKKYREIKRSMVQFRLIFGINKETSTIRVLDTYFY